MILVHFAPRSAPRCTAVTGLYAGLVNSPAVGVGPRAGPRLSLALGPGDLDGGFTVAVVGWVPECSRFRTEMGPPGSLRRRARYRQLVADPGCSLAPAGGWPAGLVFSGSAEGHGGEVGGVGYFQTQLHAQRVGEALERPKGGGCASRFQSSDG